MGDLSQSLSSDFSSAVALFAAIGFLSTIPFCIYKRQWPRTDAAISMMLDTIGIAIGVKIVCLALALPLDRLGIFADDKAFILVGGIALVVATLRQAVDHWRQVVNL